VALDVTTSQLYVSGTTATAQVKKPDVLIAVCFRLETILSLPAWREQSPDSGGFRTDAAHPTFRVYQMTGNYEC